MPSTAGWPVVAMSARTPGDDQLAQALPARRDQAAYRASTRRLARQRTEPVVLTSTKADVEADVVVHAGAGQDHPTAGRLARCAGWRCVREGDNRSSPSP